MEENEENVFRLNHISNYSSFVNLFWKDIYQFGILDYSWE